MSCRPYARAAPRALLGLWMLLPASPTASGEAVPPLSGALRPVTAAPTQLVDPPFLRGTLPRDAVAYARLPSPWGLLGAPKGNMMDRALRSPAYTAALEAIRGGLAENLMPELAPQIQPLLGLLLNHIRSPLELAVLPPAEADARLPILVATATLASIDVAAANEVLADLARQIPGIVVQTPLAADGTGLLVVRGAAVQAYFRSAERRLFLALADPALRPAPLANWVAGLQPGAAHPMHDAEKSVDGSGQGLFAWADPGALMPIMEHLGRAQEVALIRAFGGSEAEAIALGLGTSRGKQRLKLLLDMPRVGLRSLLPSVDTDLSFRTAGTPEAVGLLGLPGPDDLAMFEGALLTLMPPQEAADYRAAKAQFAETLGFGVEELLGAVGPELLLVMDQAGSYAAARLRDPSAYARILDRLVGGSKLVHERREVLGQTYHHLQIPPLAPRLPDDALARRLTELPGHLYWTREGDYLLFAMPHVLLDYRYLTDKRSLGEWLRQAQGLEPNSALLLASIRSRGTPYLTYSLNLLLLSYLGDLTDRPVDLFALPTPRELGLPEYGSYSLQLSSSPQRLAAELVYESNPMELLLAGGGLRGALMTGIIAGVAMAAYGDWRAQTQVAGVVPYVQRLQQEVTRLRRAEGRFPNDSEAVSLMQAHPMPATLDVAVVLAPDSGVISVEFGLDGLAGENRLVLSPDGTGGWTCTGSFNHQRYLPAGLCSP